MAHRPQTSKLNENGKSMIEYDAIVTLDSFWDWKEIVSCCKQNKEKMQRNVNKRIEFKERKKKCPGLFL